MHENDYKVVKFTNIADFDFLPAMGAQYAGKPFPILKGQSKFFPFTVGDKLAKHLAQQIMLRGARAVDDAAKNPNGSVLWTEEDIKKLKGKILEEVYTESGPAPQSQTDILLSRVASLNETTGGDANPATYLDKKKIVEALKKLGVTFSPRASKDELEALLKMTLDEKEGKGDAGVNASLPANLIPGEETSGAPASLSPSEIIAANQQ